MSEERVIRWKISDGTADEPARFEWRPYIPPAIPLREHRIIERATGMSLIETPGGYTEPNKKKGIVGGAHKYLFTPYGQHGTRYTADEAAKKCGALGFTHNTHKITSLPPPLVMMPVKPDPDEVCQSDPQPADQTADTQKPAVDAGNLL